MKLLKEDLWRNPNPPTMIVVTTNGTLRMDGSVVMGRGAALEATRRIPGIDLEAGKAIKHGRAPMRDGKYHYGFVVVREPKDGKCGFGIFQVKYFWGDSADLSLIEHSVLMLDTYAHIHDELSIRMNYPGIGNGRVERNLVEPLLEKLRDNVIICYR